MEPTCNNDHPIWLEARNSVRNVQRFYHIVRSRDLFGHTIVQYGWGRIGTRGQVRTLSFPNAREAHHLVGRLLRRRAGAIKRIGVGYQQLPRTAAPTITHEEVQFARVVTTVSLNHLPETRGS